MASDRPHTGRVFAAVFAVFTMLQGCSSTPGDGSESHFQACETDSDCAEAGTARYCVAGQCASTASGAAVGAGGAAGSRSGGDAGPGGATAADAGAANPGAAPTCRVPAVPLPENTPQERERAALIHDYCVTAMRDHCGSSLADGDSIVGWGALTETCSPEELLLGCKQDRLYEYTQRVAEPCDDEWRTAIACAAQATYDPIEACPRADIFLAGQGGEGICEPEKLALSNCALANLTGLIGEPVTGTHATCSHRPSRYGDSCVVSCDDQTNAFELRCDGPEGLPLSCSCSVNGNELRDDLVLNSAIYAADCGDAVLRAANGACTNRLDCCVSFVDAGVEQCACSSIPNSFGYASCEQMAAAASGQVVPICPQYEFNQGTCWPPPCTG